MYTKSLDNFFDTLPSFGPPRAVCIAVKDGKEIYHRNVGGMRDDSLCYIYSCSKPVTCAAAMQLLERGKFLLTEPVYKYLPEFRHMLVRDSNGTRPAVNEILIKDLFTMCAGLTYDRDTEYIEQLKRDSGGKCPTREAVKAFAKQPLAFEPGTRWNYSLCHDVLGALIEVISGMRFGEYLRKNIFEPCGMTDSGFKIKDKSHMERLYINDMKTITPSEPHCDFELGTEYESGGAGLISSARDYIKFASAMANGGITESGERILSRASIDLMRTNQLSKIQAESYNWGQLRGYGYGLGVRTMIDRTKGGSLSPNGEFGWAGLAGSYVIIDVENNTALFYLQQMMESLEGQIHPRLRNIFYASLDR